MAKVKWKEDMTSRYLNVWACSFKNCRELLKFANTEFREKTGLTETADLDCFFEKSGDLQKMIWDYPRSSAFYPWLNSSLSKMKVKGFNSLILASFSRSPERIRIDFKNAKDLGQFDFRTFRGRGIPPSLKEVPDFENHAGKLSLWVGSFETQTEHRKYFCLPYWYGKNSRNQFVEEFDIGAAA